MKYTCATCGKQHEQWPAIAFNAPHEYDTLSEEEKKTIAELNSDFCSIKYEDQTDRFIRAVLNQKVNDHCEDLQYGVWVSLSEKSFQDYTKNFKNNAHEAVYFGYLSNCFPGYEDMTSIETNVELSSGGNRPEVIPHQGQSTHSFVEDYYNGISLDDAEKSIRLAVGK